MIPLTIEDIKYIMNKKLALFYAKKNLVLIKMINQRTFLLHWKI